MIPNFKVTIIHAGESTDYENSVFSNINVKRRENNYDVATLVCEDKNQYYYTFKMAKFDEIKIYFKDASQSSYTQVFGGTIRQANPSLGLDGKHLTLNCKGYGAPAEDTHCNRDYGIESSNPTLNTAKKIWSDLVDNMINMSLGSAINSTGYALTKTKIADIASATNIKYINNPYRTNLEVIDTVCNLTSAIGAGATAGAHWIVDVNKNLIVNTIALHENPEVWPDWYDYLEADSTLTEGVDFTEYALLDKAEEYANHVLLLTDFRRPAYDYWTDPADDAAAQALWANEDLTSITASAVKVVGGHSLLFTPNGATAGYGYFPKNFDAAWDVTKWGSKTTIPRLNFYCRHDLLTEVTTYVYMSTNTTARKTDYFYTKFLDWGADPNNEWVHKSIPIGPYWATAEENLKYRWGQTGSPLWSKIDSIEFMIAGAAGGGILYIDDLHFSGKIIRSAKDTSEITRVNEYQKVLISRNAMDDSCVAADDSGFAGRIAYAELLRRTALPLTVTFTLKKGKPQMMAGQKTKVQLCKRSDGTFAVNTTMRMLTVEHNFVSGTGFTTTVTATTDLKNSFPISVPDAYAMWQENMFLNSSEAKNIRAGAEVDLLIPILSKSY